MHVVQTGRQGKREVGAQQGILGIASIHRVPGEGGPIAQILHSVPAVPAIAVYAAIQETPARVPSGNSAVAPSTTSPTI